MAAQVLKPISFLDTQATISGPGGSISLAADAAAAKEGLTISPNGEIGTMKIGADGSVMHILHGDNSGKAVMRFLRTSPTNQKLMAMFNFQKVSSAIWGQNIIRVGNAALGDAHELLASAFVKAPEITYADDMEFLEWEFNVGIVARVLGS